MENPFKEGDRVVILRKGIEAEAVVKTTWQHEVQVRVQSNELLWRTVKTILRTLPPLSPAEPVSSPAAAASLPTETTTAGGAESGRDDESTGAVGADEADQQAEKEEEENQEPLVVVDLPSPKLGRKDRQKRSGSRGRK